MFRSLISPLLLAAAMIVATDATVAAAEGSVHAARTRPLLVVVNQGSQTVAFVDPVPMTVTGTIPMSPAPHEAVASADGKFVYVSLYGNQAVVGGEIAVIEVAR